MRCERCHGKGRVVVALKGAEPAIAELIPCPDCNGSGITHCCDGLCEQPEKDDG